MLPRSTSGRAPSINSSSRFWISAVSLNRPPTLFTISSLFNASIIVSFVSNPAGPLVPDNLHNFLDRAVQVVVNHHVIKCPRSLGHVHLALGRAESLVDIFGLVPAPVGQTLQ